jgi:predicted nucleotidyltransferase
MHDIASAQPPASGKFLLRMEPGLHAALRSAAAAAGMSLNDFCTRKLAAPGLAVSGPGAVAVERAAAQVGSGLVGVVAFGSWARQELTARSDVDLVIVIGPEVELSRALYRPWDEEPLHWEGRTVEPHFARLPGGGRPTSLWLEVAVEGVVLFERGLEVSRDLSRIRRLIASGRVRRRWSHGQPYWVEAA